MKKALFLFALLLTATGIKAQLSSEQMTADLHYLRDTLPTKHINLFFDLSRKDFEERISDIESRIGTLSNNELYIELMKVVKSVEDSHTSISFREARKYQLPIHFLPFKEGIFVDRAERKDLLYCQLIAINGVKIKKLKSLFKEIIYHKNEAFFDYKFPQDISNAFYLQGLGIAPTTDSIDFTFRNENKETFTVTLRPNPKAKPKVIDAYFNIHSLNTAATGKIYGVSYDHTGQLAYLHYHACREDAKYPFAHFVKDVMDTLAHYSPRKIVIDLRYNSGGSSPIMKPLIDSLQCNYTSTDTKIYVIIGKQTFSSGILNAIELKERCNATLVGEHTAGEVNHYGELGKFTLPHSRASVRYSTKYFLCNDRYNGALRPDKLVPVSVDDFKQGRDGSLEYIYKQ